MDIGPSEVTVTSLSNSRESISMTLHGFKRRPTAPVDTVHVFTAEPVSDAEVKGQRRSAEESLNKVIVEQPMLLSDDKGHEDDCMSPTVLSKRSNLRKQMDQSSVSLVRSRANYRFGEKTVACKEKFFGLEDISGAPSETGCKAKD